MADKFLNKTGLSRVINWIKGLIATEDDYGMVKVNPDESISLNEQGRLVVGGRLGQFPNGGVFYPNDSTPTNINPYSFMVSEAKNFSFDATKSLGVVTGTGITCRSASAGATQYRVVNNYANRLICKVLEGGYLALNEEQAIAGNLAKVLSVQINGADYTPDSSPNKTTTANDIVITVDKTVNPSGATTSIRGYAVNSGFSNLAVGQNVSTGIGGSGASAVIGASCRNSVNWSMVNGQGHYNAGSRSALFGTTHINTKQNVLFGGQGHDSSDGANGVSAFGLWSLIDVNTALAVGNGTSHTARSNAFEVTKDGGIVLKSPDKSRWKVTVDDNGVLTSTKL